MRAVAGPDRRGPAGRAAAGRGRWVWALSGLVTAAVLAYPGVRVITRSGDTRPDQPQTTVTRTLTVLPPVTSVTVTSYGAPVQVTTGPVRHVQVTETISYNPHAGGPPAVAESVSAGRLTLADPACSDPGPSAASCEVHFVLTMPPGLSLTAMTGGGPLVVVGLAGPLRADTGGGPLQAEGLRSATVTARTDGGEAQLAFAVPPTSVLVTTGGGPATLTVPGGPYALTADSNDGPQSIAIPTSPAAPRSLTISTNGGPLGIVP